MITWLNPASLMFGIIAWMLSVINHRLVKKYDQSNWAAFSIISISACAVSLWLQIVYGYYLVKIEDWAAHMDTRGAVVFFSVVLLMVTFI
ncbi:MAG: hypothetical protein GX088_08185 [Clostridia bacterium]|nr:hypothetical protein [Clostridia bacterium]